MPVAAIPGEEAYRNLRSSKASLWPDERSGDERLEGFVRLELAPTFSFSRADRIMTLGSCFARGIENRLAEHGFDVPMRQIGRDGPGGRGLIDADHLTKFTIQSIENELRWAAGEPMPEPEALFLEGADGRWHDPQLVQSAQAAPLAQVMERRANIRAAVARFPECRIVIVTLGLAEAWFDAATGLYLNVAPPMPAIRRHPGRFKLHVLSHDEILATLERIHALLQARGHPEVRMLVTVSPVPFKATFSGEDVIVANSYSKSVQRAACQAFVARCEGVDYFPSYEIVAMTSRQIAYEIDNLHVAPDMVRHIMNEVLGAYAPDIEGSPVGAVLAQSRTRRELNGHLDAVAKAKHLVQLGRHAEAAAACDELLRSFAASMSPTDLSAVRSVYAAALRSQGLWDEARAQLEAAAQSDPRGGEVFYKLGQCLQKLHRHADAVLAFRKAIALNSARPEYSAHLEIAEARLAAQAAAETGKDGARPPARNEA